MTKPDRHMDPASIPPHVVPDRFKVKPDKDGNRASRRAYQRTHKVKPT